MNAGRNVTDRSDGDEFFDEGVSPNDPIRQQSARAVSGVSMAHISVSPEER
jgi:hypothetical protein